MVILAKTEFNLQHFPSKSVIYGCHSWTHLLSFATLVNRDYHLWLLMPVEMELARVMGRVFIITIIIIPQANY